MTVTVADDVCAVWPGCSDSEQTVGHDVGAVCEARISASEVSGWALFVFLLVLSLNSCCLVVGSLHGSPSPGVACVDEGDVLSCLHDTHSFQEEALISESVGPDFCLHWGALYLH